VGVLFVVNRARREFDAVEQSTGRDGVVEAAEGTPLAGLVDDLPDLDRRVPMTKRQRVNVHLVMVVAQIVQVALIGLVVWLFFVIFTAVAIRLPVQQNWLKDLGGVGAYQEWGNGHVLTQAAIRVSAFLGGFAAFYATVYAASDKVYRKYFAERISHDISRALAVRRGYLALRRRARLPAPDPQPAEPDSA
jgi:nitrate reductase NapE component